MPQILDDVSDSLLDFNDSYLIGDVGNLYDFLPEIISNPDLCQVQASVQTATSTTNPSVR